MPLRVSMDSANQSARYASYATSSRAADLIAKRTTAGPRSIAALAETAQAAQEERRRSMVNQADQTIKNLQSTVSMIQTADQALSSQSDNLVSLRQLAAQASSGTLTDDERSALDTQAKELVKSIESTARDTEFNGAKLLDGSTTSVQTGANSTTVTFQSATAESLGIDALSLSTAEGATAAMDTIENAMKQVQTYQQSLGGNQNRVTSELESTQATRSALSQSIRDEQMATDAITQLNSRMIGEGAMIMASMTMVSANRVLSLLG